MIHIAITIINVGVQRRDIFNPPNWGPEDLSGDELIFCVYVFVCVYVCLYLPMSLCMVVFVAFWR